MLLKQPAIHILHIGVIIAILCCFFSGINAQDTSFRFVVYDYDNHTPLAGVTVTAVVYNKKQMTVTGTEGSFRLSIPANEYYTLTFSYIGYKKLVIQMEPSSNAVVFYMKKKPPDELDEILVEARKKYEGVKDIQMNPIKINPALLKRTPLVLGEADIIRALTLQPGIVSNGETVSGYNVRGGNADQNLILIDGAPVFNIAHLLGFYSGVSADAVQDITFYKAGIPSQYGDRLSSVMLMNIKNGNPDSMRYNFGISPVSTNFFINGPIVKNKLTIMAGGRIAYPKIMMNLIPGEVQKSNAFYFDDILKLSFTPNLNNRISFTFYNSYDMYRFPGDTSYSWKNTVGSLQWKSKLSNNLNMLVSGNFSRYKSFINGLKQKYAYQLESGIQQKEGKVLFNYNFSPDDILTFGGSFTNTKINPGELNPTGSSAVIHKEIEPENAGQWSGFISTQNNLNKFLLIQFGVRFTQYQYLGPKTVFVYKNGEPVTVESISDTIYYTNNKSIKNYFGFEPRLSLRVLLNNTTSVKLAYNRIYQYMHLVSNATSVTPVDYWKLSDTHIQPEHSDQYAIGFFKTLQDEKYETVLETYYKKNYNVVEYKNGASLSLNPALETQLLPSSGYAYGAEFSVKKNKGKLTGMLAYTYSRSFTKIETAYPGEMVNGGNYFPSTSDRPHNIILTGSYNLGKGWLFSTNFIYTSGRTATYPDGSYIINGTVVTNYSTRNQDRLPSYHRMDIAFSFDSRRYPQQRKYSVVNFSFYNLYMRNNVYAIFFKREDDLIKSYQLSVIGSIVPSVSWNYNF